VLTLAFDAATRWGRFALAEAGELLVDQPHNVAGSYADALMPVVESLCSVADRRLADVQAVAVTRGPGSFTGVRIAVATAKGLAYALGARLVAVPTTEAMAGALLEDHPEATLAVPVLDARRGELFAAIYHRHADWVAEVVAPAARTPDDWWAAICTAVDDLEAPVFGGDGLGLLLTPDGHPRPELTRAGRPVRRLWSTAHPDTARTLATVVSADRPVPPPVDPFAVVPLYLRGSDAEVKRRVDVTPREFSPRFESHAATVVATEPGEDGSAGESGTDGQPTDAGDRRAHPDRRDRPDRRGAGRGDS